jgi:hypothetical protein
MNQSHWMSELIENLISLYDYLLILTVQRAKMTPNGNVWLSLGLWVLSSAGVHSIIYTWTDASNKDAAIPSRTIRGSERSKQLK